MDFLDDCECKFKFHACLKVFFGERAIGCISLSWYDIYSAFQFGVMYGQRCQPFLKLCNVGSNKS